MYTKLYSNAYYYSKPSLIRLQLFRESDNPDQSMENDKFSSKLST
jgi:hypothetical protein